MNQIEFYSELRIAIINREWDTAFDLSFQVGTIEEAPDEDLADLDEAESDYAYDLVSAVLAAQQDPSGRIARFLRVAPRFVSTAAYTIGSDDDISDLSPELGCLLLDKGLALFRDPEDFSDTYISVQQGVLRLLDHCLSAQEAETIAHFGGTLEAFSAVIFSPSGAVEPGDPFPFWRTLPGVVSGVFALLETLSPLELAFLWTVDVDLPQPTGSAGQNSSSDREHLAELRRSAVRLSLARHGLERPFREALSVNWEGALDATDLITQNPETFPLIPHNAPRAIATLVDHPALSEMPADKVGSFVGGVLSRLSGPTITNAWGILAESLLRQEQFRGLESDCPVIEAIVDAMPEAGASNDTMEILEVVLPARFGRSA